MTQDLRVGVMGYGIGGRRFHVPLVAATQGLCVAAVVTSNPERVDQVRREYPEAAVLASDEDLFARADELDVVVVSTPNSTHVPLALRAIELGLPVVVDKPFAPTVATAEQLMRAASDAGVLLTVFQNRRWDSDFLTVKKVLHEGDLGEVLRFESRYDRWQPTLKDNWRELADPGEAGGLLYDLGAHIIDQALQLWGPVVEVYAELDRRRPDALVDDDVFVALRHHSGVRSHLWASTLAGSLNPRFRIMGETGTFAKYGLDPQEPQVLDGLRPGDPGWGVEPDQDAGSIGRGDGSTYRVPTEVGCYEQFYLQLREALRGNDAVPVDPDDALQALRIIEAAQRSAAERSVVILDQPPRR